MKQSAAKTLGVAALGAAIAAAGAGAANAAPAAPDATRALGTVTKSLPGAGGALTQGQSALGAGLESAQPTTDKVLTGGPTNPAAGLLGGLPLQGLSGKGKAKGKGK